MPATEEKRHASKVIRHLKKEYPQAECALHHDSAFQLLIATILSAQCTDKRVNIVTRDLFANYPTAEHLAVAPIRRVEKLVQSTGFFRNKAKNIKACAQQLVAQHDGEVPRSLPELVALPGVGRKTANVVLGTAFQIPSGVVVDTHVGRISRRLGLTNQTNPEIVERELNALLPQREWVAYSHRMILHGRQVCKSRNPQCAACRMNAFCPRIGVAGAKAPGKTAPA